MVVAPDAGAHGPIGIGDSGLTPAGRDAGLPLRFQEVIPLPMPERVAPSG
jgi:hypothetical protein